MVVSPLASVDVAILVHAFASPARHVFLPLPLSIFIDGSPEDSRAETGGM